MADTTFIDHATIIQATWLNDVNDFVYSTLPVGRKVSVPSTATSTGLPGQWAADNSFFYVYTGDGTTHTWRRVAVAAW